MKKIGIIGGMSPESTIAYYQYITHTYTQRYGDYRYPEVLIYSVSFQDYVDWPAQDRWDRVADGLCGAARTLEAAGAGVIAIATNTMHRVYDQVQAAVSVPLISVLDVTADAIQSRELTTVGLLGTRYTMEGPLYPDALSRGGINVLTPGGEERAFINNAIYTELVNGQVLPKTRARFLEIIDQLARRGAQGIILGCTEIPLLVNAEDTPLPLFDTTTLHAEALLVHALVTDSS
jgi:aspartate racemase